MGFFESLVIGVFLLLVIPFALYVFFKTPTKFELMKTLDEYLIEHPDCKTKNGIKCFKCDSKSIKNWGLHRADSIDRLFICNHCNEHLYRSNTVIKNEINQKYLPKDDPWIK